MSLDYEQLLYSVIADTGKWYENPPEDVKKFLVGVEELLKNGKHVNGAKISEIINEQLSFNVSDTSVRSWIKETKKKYQNS